MPAQVQRWIFGGTVISGEAIFVRRLGNWATLPICVPRIRCSASGVAKGISQPNAIRQGGVLIFFWGGSSSFTWGGWGGRRFCLFGVGFFLYGGGGDLKIAQLQVRVGKVFPRCASQCSDRAAIALEIQAAAFDSRKSGALPRSNPMPLHQRPRSAPAPS